MPCELEPFGCCNDNMTAAHGPNKEGCCLNTAYGCCPDNILAASGPNLEGLYFQKSFNLKRKNVYLIYHS